jgi:hypothetical protein
MFYNCTSPWFGSACQYTFEYDPPSSFSDIVHITFTDHTKEYQAMEDSTCYPFLINCYRGPLPTCIDWREICNGIFDYVNGEDEQWCEQLELNECTKDEYRCRHGGQCIPLTFVRDGSRSTDCLDGSDEMDTRKENFNGVSPLNCNTIPTFLCEENACRSTHAFSCGDGQCVSFNVALFYSMSCINWRNRKIT